MRKRYWIVGAIVFYTFSRMLAGNHGSDDIGAANSPPISEQRKQPPSVSTETSTSAPQAAVSEATTADGEKTERQTAGQDYPPRFVTGNRVAFRSGPSTGDSIIDRFDYGRPVLLIEESADWSHIKTNSPTGRSDSFSVSR